MSTEASFPNAATSVAEARHFVSDLLAGSSAQLRQRVELMVSELATNAVKHARSGFRLTVEQRRGGVRIVVTDEGAGTPRRRTPSSLEPTGRGLAIVEALADDWGVDGHASGKAVWFSLSELLAAGG